MQFKSILFRQHETMVTPALVFKLSNASSLIVEKTGAMSMKLPSGQTYAVQGPDKWKYLSNVHRTLPLSWSSTWTVLERACKAFQQFNLSNREPYLVDAEFLWAVAAGKASRNLEKEFQYA